MEAWVSFTKSSTLHLTARDQECLDIQLQAYLAQCILASERRDLNALRALFQMSEDRLLNVESMLRTYQILTLSLQRILHEDVGAMVTP